MFILSADFRNPAAFTRVTQNGYKNNEQRTWLKKNWKKESVLFVWLLLSLLTTIGMWVGKALWILAAVWFVIAYLVEVLVLRPKYRAMQLRCELDPEALQKQTLYQMGDDDLLNAELR